MSNKKADFLVDLPMVFSVVRPEELVASANEFYGTNMILPTPGSKFDARTERGIIHEFHLYKITMNKLDKDERSLKNNVSGFETFMEKMGVFTNIYEVMTFAETITIFSSLEEADLFLRACLRSNSSITTKSVFLCTDTEIEGLD